MSNHLREFLESQSIYFADGFGTADLVDESRKIAKDAICFWCGSVNDFMDLNLVADLIRLPYEKCWFECVFDVGSKETVVGNIAREEGAKIIVDVYVREERKWKYAFTWEYEKGCDVYEATLINFHEDQSGANLGAAHVIVSGVKNFLQAINCSNINRVEHKPSEKLKKARAKRGKQPLFSYWTLEIDLSKSRAAGENYGGTHAAPRLHLRRGHPRQYAPGKYCWVQPCVVGNKAAGMVHKDYAARYQ